MERSLAKSSASRIGQKVNGWNSRHTRVGQKLNAARVQNLKSRVQLELRPTFGSSERQSAPSCLRATSAEADQATSTSSSVRSFHNGVTYTYYESNSFGLRFNSSGVNLLVDPWLTDDLVFFGQDSVYRGKKKMLKKQSVDIGAIAAETDIILITQYLPDHFHEPTMKLLPRHLPVVASPLAAVQAKELGFTTVVSLPHGKSVSMLEGKLLIRATAGAEVGPPWVPRENGFVLQETIPSGPGVSVYYEPHCSFGEASLQEVGHVDVVISPIASQILGVNGVGYPVVEGDVNLGRLLQLLTPKVVLATTPGDIEAEGVLAPYIFERGSLADAQAQLRKLGLTTRIEMPGPAGEALAVAV